MKKTMPLKPRVQAYERSLIRQALAQHGNDPTQAAAALRIHVATLNRKLK